MDLRRGEAGALWRLLPRLHRNFRSLSVGLLAQLMRAHRGSSAAVSLKWGVNVVETALRDATAVAQLPVD